MTVCDRGGLPSAEGADLLRRLDGLQAQVCGMAHERVAAGAPRHDPSGETAIPRPPLCAAARRRANLACTHGRARETLREALRLLAERDPAGGHAEALDRLAAVDRGLGPLDHARYDAETRMALARAASDAGAMHRAGRAIDASIAAHDAAAALLADLRAQALAGLDALTAGEGGRAEAAAAP